MDTASLLFMALVCFSLITTFTHLSTLNGAETSSNDPCSHDFEVIRRKRSTKFECQLCDHSEVYVLDSENTRYSPF